MACHYDDTLGPTLPQEATAGCRMFDFTLAFEDLIFTLIPCLLVLPTIALCIRRVIPQPKYIDWKICWSAKLVSHGHVLS